MKQRALSASRGHLGLSLRQCHRSPLPASSSKQQDQSTDIDAALPAITVASTAVFCISSLLNGAALPSVKFACTATVIGAAAAELVLGNKGNAGKQRLFHTTKGNTDRGSSSSSSGSTMTSSRGQFVADVLSRSDPRPAVAAAAGGAVLSALLPPEELPALSSLCLLVYVGVTVRKHQQQEGANLLQEAAAAGGQEKQEMLQQLQRQADQVRALSLNIQQLERELKHARKGTKKLDTMKEQLKQEQAAKQQLEFKLLLVESQLQDTQELLAAQQAAAKAAASRRNSQDKGSSGSSTGWPASAPTPEQQQQQQQPAETGAGAAAGATRRVVAFVGGRKMKPSDRKLLPVEVDEVRFYGSPRDAGSGDLKRLEAAIKAGSIDEVYMQTRWSSHTRTQLVTRLCKDRGIPCHLLDSGGKAFLPTSEIKTPLFSVVPDFRKAPLVRPAKTRALPEGLA